MKVLVLGPNGQLGSDFIRAASAFGIEVHGIGRADLDVSDPAALESRLSGLSFDVLVNCTSYHRTDEAESNASLAFAVNAHAVQRMARVCRTRRARFAHVSTDFVYGGNRGRSRPYVEGDEPRPINVYGASKAMGELLAAAECEDILVIRVASLFGVAGASGKGGNFVETMLRLAKSQPELKVVADQTMSPTATADVANAMVGLLQKRAPTGIYHVVNSGQATWHEFTCEIMRQTKNSVPVMAISSEKLNQAAKRPHYSVLNNAKAAAVVQPLPHWSEALAVYLRSKGHIG